MQFKPSKHWDYFLTIESDLQRCSRYVEFNESNFNCYSNEFAKIIMLACSEIDVIFRELHAHLYKTNQQLNIKDYYQLIIKESLSLIECKVEIQSYELILCPWSEWNEKENPTWWSKAYNKIKHDRYMHFQQANLKNALLSVGAQFTTLLYYHSIVNNEGLSVDLNRRSSLFDLYRPNNLGGVAWGYGDPRTLNNAE